MHGLLCGDSESLRQAKLVMKYRCYESKEGNDKQYYLVVNMRIRRYAVLYPLYCAHKSFVLDAI
uniref:Uncharacterized protein n=1 Tax=Onchocerca volvulus TaxID=6282 RepID=A0A8R1U121_ONCVO